MSDLPIDETWILVGIFILAIAAISHLHTMWKEARHGVADSGPRNKMHGADEYFSVWQAVGEGLGLAPVPMEGESWAPTLRGELRGLAASVEMELQKSGGRRLDPKALNPATVSCRIKARLALPFPWPGVTIREFIRTDSTKKEGCDDLSLGDPWPGDAYLECARLDRRARRALTDMVDEFDKVTIIDGTLTVVHTVHPSRNTSQWKRTFRDILDSIRRQSRGLADGGVTLDFEAHERDPAMTMRLERNPNGLSNRYRVQIEHPLVPSGDEDGLEAQIEACGARIESRETTGGRRRIEAVISGADTDLIRGLTEVLLSRELESSGPPANR